MGRKQADAYASTEYRQAATSMSPALMQVCPLRLDTPVRAGGVAGSPLA